MPEALCWAGGERLFGAGLGGHLVEYDLQQLRVKYSVEGFGGPIWSLVAHPAREQLAVSSADGTSAEQHCVLDGTCCSWWHSISARAPKPCLWSQITRLLSCREMPPTPDQVLL